jgi:hypothetical protein
VPGKHYGPNSIAAPVTSDVTIRIVLTLLLLAKWYAELIDVNGAFCTDNLRKEIFSTWRFRRDLSSTIRKTTFGCYSERSMD